MSDRRRHDEPAAGVEEIGGRAGRRPGGQPLRRRLAPAAAAPIFIISGILIVILALMAVWPGLFTRTDPRACNLADSLLRPSSEHWFGTDVQGCDYYARTIWGARVSITIGVLVTAVSTLIAVVAGLHRRVLRRDRRHADRPAHRHLVRHPHHPRRHRDPAVDLLDPRPAAGEPGADRARVAHHAAPGALGGDVHQGDGLRRRRPGAGGAQLPHHPPAHPAQRHGPGDRLRHHHRGGDHLRRGGALLPRRGPAAAGDLLGADDQRGPEPHPHRSPPAALPGSVPLGDGVQRSS